MRINKPVTVTGVMSQVEMRFTTSGRAVTTWVITMESGSVVPCEAWQALAEAIVDNYDDGSVCTVNGAYATRSYKGRNDQERAHSYFLVKSIRKTS